MADPNRYSEEIALLYDATHDYGDVGDESFYVEAARQADGPVLEGACGTGRLYLELLRRGVDADGFDVSPAMLERLREAASEEGLSPSVWTDDLRSFDTGRRYALAIVPYNSVPTLRTVDDQFAALEALHAALEPGGRLVFDAYVPRYDVVADAFGEWRSVGTIERDGETLRGRSRARIDDEVNQTYRTEQELVTVDGAVVARDEFVLSHLPPQQVELLARASPFEEWTAWGGFDRAPLTDGADVQVWELVK